MWGGTSACRSVHVHMLLQQQRASRQGRQHGRQHQHQSCCEPPHAQIGVAFTLIKSTAAEVHTLHRQSQHTTSLKNRGGEGCAPQQHPVTSNNTSSSSRCYIIFTQACTLFYRLLLCECTSQPQAGCQMWGSTRAPGGLAPMHSSKHSNSTSDAAGTRCMTVLNRSPVWHC